MKTNSSQNTGPWEDGPYIRTLLNAREKWATVLSLTAIAGLFAFLADGRPHPHVLELSPVLVGVLGSIYIFVVNCYYAEAAHKAEHKTKYEPTFWSWFRHSGKIKALGWLSNLIPFLVGASAWLILSIDSGWIRNMICGT